MKKDDLPSVGYSGFPDGSESEFRYRKECGIFPLFPVPEGGGNRGKGFRVLRKEKQKRFANGNQQTADERKKPRQRSAAVADFP